MGFACTLAMDSQVGCDTLPLSIGMQDPSIEAMTAGIPAVLISLITGLLLLYSIFCQHRDVLKLRYLLTAAKLKEGP